MLCDNENEPVGRDQNLQVLWGLALGSAPAINAKRRNFYVWLVEVWGLASGLAPAMKAKKTELLGLGCGTPHERLTSATRAPHDTKSMDFLKGSDRHPFTLITANFAPVSIYTLLGVTRTVFYQEDPVIDLWRVPGYLTGELCHASAAI
jgi:hypothetical protein